MIPDRGVSPSTFTLTCSSSSCFGILQRTCNGSSADVPGFSLNILFDTHDRTNVQMIWLQNQCQLQPTTVPASDENRSHNDMRGSLKLPADLGERFFLLEVSHIDVSFV
ncbi:hypothetical protein BYT27DRAFT_7186587 [Phlegmacium glaucopus]|nr:hypothetical protein BYT27DRAFT_7186587 [Phlegmacium glaucopus]